MGFTAFELNLAPTLRRAFALLLVSTVIGSSALAGDGKGNNGNGNNGNGKGNGGPSVSGPEIDLGSLSGALTLLVGGTLVVTERLRRK